jgi:hypothetical protein
MLTPPHRCIYSAILIHYASLSCSMPEGRHWHIRSQPRARIATTKCVLKHGILDTLRVSMPERVQNPSQPPEDPLSGTLLPPASRGSSAHSAAESKSLSLATKLNRLIVAQESWQETFCALSEAINCHPETAQIRKRPANDAEHAAEPGVATRSESDDLRCKRHLQDARSLLNPYKKLFTEWLRGEEFFELFKQVWLPLPAEPLTQENFTNQIPSTAGPEFYVKLRAIWEPRPLSPPKQEELRALFDKVIRFCEWQTAPTDTIVSLPQEPRPPSSIQPERAHSPSSTPAQSRGNPYSLSDLQEIQATLVMMFVLFADHISPLSRSNPSLLPREAS